MKFFVIFAIIGAAAAASVPSGVDKEAPILKQDVDVGVDGTWHYNIETGNGIVMEEHGLLKTVDQKEVAEAVGSVSYTAPDGQPIQLSWIANENGYQPQGSHLPVPPPVPELILRALEYNAAHPQKEEPIQRKL